MGREPGWLSVGVLRVLDLGRNDTGQNLKDIPHRPVFILSTGRTGTQFLAHHFDNDPRVRAFHEPAPSRGLRLWTVAYLEGAVDQASMTRTLRAYRTGFFEGIDEPIYVESNNFLAGFAESLICEFDEPTLIHVVRDPRTYVRSAINNGAALGWKGFANRYLPFAHVELEPTSENPSIQRSARYWSLVNRHLHTVGESYDAYHVFRYEDLFSDDSQTLSRLAEIIGVGDRAMSRPESTRRLNQSPHSVMPPWEEWSPSEQTIVIDECGELMAHFDYRP